MTVGCDFSSGAGIGADGVDLVGTVTVPGAPGSAGSGAGGSAGPAPVVPVCDITLPQCRSGYTVTSPLDGRGPITLADLVNFRPTAGVHRMEPNGWMVVGLDTNFYAETGAHVQNNLLLGIPASVRFTPVSYHWTYGDGSSATRSTAGTSWRAQGVAEFEPTSTSHVYRARGTYVIDLTIDFRAEYRFGPSAWIPIAGTLSIPSDRLTAVAGDATTVLVDRECTTDPSGPGC